MEDALSLGTYVYARSTKNTKRYERLDENDRRWTHYLANEEAAALGNPDRIEVLVRAVG